MSKSIRVVLADDHPLVRAGLRAVLTAEPAITVVGEAADGDEAQRLCRARKPHVLLLDLKMPGPPAVETIAVIREHCPETQVVVLTAYDDDAYVRGLLAAGVAGYVLKDEASEAVVRAVCAAARGNGWFSRSIMDKLVHEEPAASARRQLHALTDREHEVLRLIAAGKTNHQIARDLGLSVKTVEKHIREVFMKLRVSSRVEAAVWATRAGLE